VQHEADAPAIDLVRPPGGLGEKPRQVGLIRTVEDAAGDIGHAFVGQDDQARQIVLKMPKLALVLKQVAEDRRVRGDHRSRLNNRQFHHTPPYPGQGTPPDPRVALGSMHGKSQLSSKVKDIWSNPQVINNSGAGINAPNRIRKIVPVGRKVFAK